MKFMLHEVTVSDIDPFGASTDTPVGMPGGWAIGGLAVLFLLVLLLVQLLGKQRRKQINQEVATDSSAEADPPVAAEPTPVPPPPVSTPAPKPQPLPEPAAPVVEVPDPTPVPAVQAEPITDTGTTLKAEPVLESAAETASADPNPEPAETVAETAEASAAPVAPVVEAEPQKPDNLRKIEGIGPKISGVLKDAGITTFAQLAALSVEDIQKILDASHINLRLAKPDTWVEQAALAAEGSWDKLATLQDELKGGRRQKS